MSHPEIVFACPTCGVAFPDTEQFDRHLVDDSGHEISTDSPLRPLSDLRCKSANEHRISGARLDPMRRWIPTAARLRREEHGQVMPEEALAAFAAVILGLALYALIFAAAIQWRNAAIESTQPPDVEVPAVVQPYSTPTP